jgi:tRNA modification GTPase
VLDLLHACVLDLGARPARPGEFTERAFLNGKLDLAQAEAVADLIEAATSTQARLAGRSLRGAFSRRVQALVEDLTRLRVTIEAALDFPDEDLESLGVREADLSALISATHDLLGRSQQGELIRDGLLVVIAGAPNAGKSSLLNALAETDAAIVTEIPGTTRDLLRAEIQIDGLPIRLIDTAGLRPAQDPVEQEGIRRARAQLAQADHILLVLDDTEPSPLDTALDRLFSDVALPQVPITLVQNKADLSGRPIATSTTDEGYSAIACSALTGAGLDLVRDQLKTAAGYLGPDSGEFLARRRHVDAINRALERLNSARTASAARTALELVAEDLRCAQNALSEITGEVTSDDLLGRIFSDFCIGK